MDLLRRFSTEGKEESVNSSCKLLTRGCNNTYESYLDMRSRNLFLFDDFVLLDTLVRVFSFQLDLRFRIKSNSDLGFYRSLHSVFVRDVMRESYEVSGLSAITHILYSLIADFLKYCRYLINEVTSLALRPKSVAPCLSDQSHAKYTAMAVDFRSSYDVISGRIDLFRKMEGFSNSVCSLRIMFVMANILI